MRNLLQLQERGIEETVLFITGDVLDDGREKFKRSTANIASTKVIPAKVCENRTILVNLYRTHASVPR